MPGEGIDIELVRRVLRERTRPGGQISQRKLSLGAGMSPSAVNDILQGKSELPNINTLMALADALGEPLSIFGIDSKPLVTTEAELRQVIEEALPHMPSRGWKRQSEYLAEAVAGALGLPGNRPATEANGAG
jgi:transcriptional regulator with XRE-family HTH domain